MDWKAKGREFADRVTGDGALVSCARIYLRKTGEERCSVLAKHSADLLAAARWGALSACSGRVTADRAESEALDLLHAGFVERLREIAGP